MSTIHGRRIERPIRKIKSPFQHVCQARPQASNDPLFRHLAVTMPPSFKRESRNSLPSLHCAISTVSRRPYTRYECVSALEPTGGPGHNHKTSHGYHQKTSQR
eukprot:4577682-Pleurochrysis_carterae.AAC.2